MKTLLIYSFVFITLVMLSACEAETQHQHTSDETTHTEKTLHAKEASTNQLFLSQEQLNKLGIELGKAEVQNMPTRLEATATVHLPPQNRASVGTILGGKIKEIRIHEGDMVRKGQVIALLENIQVIQLQEEFLKVKAELDVLTSNLERQTNLRTQQANAEKTLQQAQSDLKIAQAKKASLASQLALVHINANQLTESNLQSSYALLAPISGSTFNISAKLGEFLPANTPIVEILNEEHLHIEIQIYEQDITGIDLNQVVEFVSYNTAQTLPIPAKIYSISKSIDPVTKTVSVHAEIEGKTTLRDGTMGKVFITKNNTNTLTLPKDATVTNGTQTFAFVQRKAEGNGFWLEKIALDQIYSFQNSLQSKSLDSSLIYIKKGAYYAEATLQGKEEGGGGHTH